MGTDKPLRPHPATTGQPHRPGNVPAGVLQPSGQRSAAGYPERRTPADDRDSYNERVHHIAGTAARLAGRPDPAGHAARVVEAFLPDMLTYRPGQPAAFHLGDGNGRALGDNAFDIAIAVLAGATLGNASTPRQATPAFPYLSATGTVLR